MTTESEQPKESTQPTIDKHLLSVKERVKHIAENLIETTWDQLMEEMQEQIKDGDKFAFSIKYTLPASFPQIVKFQLNRSFSKSVGGEITVEHPDQEDLPFEGEEEVGVEAEQNEEESPKQLKEATKALPEPDVIDVEDENEG